MRLPPTSEMIKNAEQPKNVYDGKTEVPENATYEEKFFKQQVTDHFNFQDLGKNSTFEMRYLENSTFWEKGSKNLC